MAFSDLPQVSFGGGIVSPEVYARLDLAKFSSGLADASNYLVRVEGGLSNRAGFRFIKEVKDSTMVVRLIDFRFNELQTYVLEWGDQYLRILQNGGLLLEADQAITGATQADPVVVTITGHGYSNNDEVFIEDVVGMTELNDKFYVIGGVTANTFELTGVDGTGYSAYVSGGTAARVLELTTPYSSSDLALLKYRQSNDVLYLTHPNHPPHKLIRTGASAWSLEEILFKPLHDYPTNVSVTPNIVGSQEARYQVTAVAQETGEESLAGVRPGKAITGASQTDPVVLTVVAHQYEEFDEVEVQDIVGMTELNDRRFVIGTILSVDTFELKEEDGTSYNAYVSGGEAFKTHTVTQSSNAEDQRDNTITWDEIPGTAFYNVYRYRNAIYGFIGSTEIPSFNDVASLIGDPDLLDTPPKLRQPFTGVNNYPGAVGLHEQRTVWGRTNNNPLTTFLSQTTQFENMNVSTPTKADDAVTVWLVTGHGNEIRHFRSMSDRLLIFTSGMVRSLRPGGDADAITPESKQLLTEERLPTTQTPPIDISGSILIISGVEDFGFEVHLLRLNLDAYVGSDLSILARHLFEEYTLSEWAYAHRPFRLAAAVRNDGKLVVMSFFEEQQVFAWTVWETDGEFESICSVGEGQKDYFYCVIKRTINGTERRYIERLNERYFQSIEDAFFVDSGLTLDITNPQDVISATQTDPVVVGVTAHGYSNGDEVYLANIGGMTEISNRRFGIKNVAADTFELVAEDGTGYEAFTSGGTAQKVVNTFSGLDHLEGKTVIALIDGNLEEDLTVVNGSVTADVYGAVAQIGLSYRAYAQSLPLDLGAETLARKKVVKQMIIQTLDTRGVYAGPDLDNLEEYPVRSTEKWGDPAALISDKVQIAISDDWLRMNQVVVASEPGLPQTILAWHARTDFA